MIPRCVWDCMYDTFNLLGSWFDQSNFGITFLDFKDFDHLSTVIVIYIGYGPLTVTVTTWIITFLVGHPNRSTFICHWNPVRGPHPKYTCKDLHNSSVTSSIQLTLPHRPKKMEDELRSAKARGSRDDIVDGSEIPLKTTVWMYKTLVNHGDKLPTSTGDRRISEPSRVFQRCKGKLLFDGSEILEKHFVGSLSASHTYLLGIFHALIPGLWGEEHIWIGVPRGIQVQKPPLGKAEGIALGITLWCLVTFAACISVFWDFVSWNEQWSFHPGWLGYIGDYTVIGIIINPYKDPY